MTSWVVTVRITPGTADLEGADGTRTSATAGSGSSLRVHPEAPTTHHIARASARDRIDPSNDPRPPKVYPLRARPDIERPPPRNLSRSAGDASQPPAIASYTPDLSPQTLRSPMHDGANLATQAWSRMETQFATTRATTGESAVGLPRPDPTRRTLSVLPLVEAHPDGDVRLVHDPKDRYRSLGILGEGGMGIVERAEDIDIGRAVAIKRLLPEATHPLGVARFVSEVRIVGSLEHPNVAPIHDVGLDQHGNYFFVMKYVEGQTLADVIHALAAGDPQAHAAWTFERRAELIISVLRALEYAHSRGIVHRDIKPDNIMIGRFGEVWLMDWGIAKKIGEPDPGVPLHTDDPTAGLIGTPAYMSPEQVRCAELDARSDIYSVAVTLHEFIGLRHYLAAHKEGSLAGLLAAVEREVAKVHGRAQYDTTHQSLPPVELQRIAECGLAKDPAHRFQTAADMREELSKYIEGRTGVHCVYSFTKRSMRESSRLVDRYPRLAVSAFFGLVGFALLGLTLLLRIALGLS